MAVCGYRLKLNADWKRHVFTPRVDYRFTCGPVILKRKPGDSKTYVREVSDVAVAFGAVNMATARRYLRRS